MSTVRSEKVEQDMTSRMKNVRSHRRAGKEACGCARSPAFVEDGKEERRIGAAERGAATSPAVQGWMLSVAPLAVYGVRVAARAAWREDEACAANGSRRTAGTANGSALRRRQRPGGRRWLSFARTRRSRKSCSPAYCASRTVLGLLS